MKIRKEVQSMAVAMGFTLALLGLFTAPEMAYAVSYDTAVQLLKEFTRFLFVDAGPYIFMIAFGIVLVGVGKGWIPVKAGVVIVIVCFAFFAVPTIVRNLQQQAASQI